jgi:hypothetical protein
VWPGLFQESTFVRPYQFPDYQGRNILSFPVRSTLAYLKDIYTTVGESSPDELPGRPGSRSPNPALDRLSNDLGGILEYDEDFRKRL